MTRIAAYAALAASVLLPLAAVAADQHTVVQPDGIKWGAAPPNLPKGAQLAVLVGDPGKAEPFVVRAKLPAGYKVPAHTHPTDEDVTVLSGTFHVGMGGKLDPDKGDTLKAGGFAHLGKGMQHYAWASEETVIQIHGMGPFLITYVNPADDPSKTN